MAARADAVAPPLLWVADGAVWSQFLIPAAPSFKDLRAREYAAARTRGAGAGPGSAAPAGADLGALSDAEATPSLARLDVPAAWR